MLVGLEVVGLDVVPPGVSTDRVGPAVARPDDVGTWLGTTVAVPFSVGVVVGVVDELGVPDGDSLGVVVGVPVGGTGLDGFAGGAVVTRTGLADGVT